LYIEDVIDIFGSFVRSLYLSGTCPSPEFISEPNFFIFFHFQVPRPKTAATESSERMKGRNIDGPLRAINYTITEYYLRKHLSTSKAIELLETFVRPTSHHCRGY